jgi:hypothetical protein
LKARDESLGVHCHGWPEPAARAAVFVRTCAPTIVGASAQAAMIDVRNFCVLLRMLDSSEKERRRGFSPRITASEPTLHRLIGRICKNLALHTRGTDVELHPRGIIERRNANVKIVRCAGVWGGVHLHFK